MTHDDDRGNTLLVLLLAGLAVFIVGVVVWGAIKLIRYGLQHQRRRTMRALRILACAAAAMSVGLAMPRPGPVQARWPSVTQPPMTLELFLTAHKAAARPIFVAHCQWPVCRFS